MPVPPLCRSSPSAWCSLAPNPDMSPQTRNLMPCALGTSRSLLMVDYGLVQMGTKKCFGLDFWRLIIKAKDQGRVQGEVGRG